MTGRLEEMEAFVAVAAAGGFTAAARRLDTSTSRLSRTIAGLETRLGARLFHRSTRALALTEAGASYLDAASRLIDDARAAEDAVSGLTGSLSGLVRVAAPISLGADLLAPALHCFMTDHPALCIELMLDDRTIDIIGEGVDIALRVGPALADSGLIARTVRPVELLLVAAPALLDRVGRPATPEALAAIPSLTYSNVRGDEQWRFATANGTRLCRGPVRLRSDSGSVLCAAAIAGLGVTISPDFIVGTAVADGRLEIVLPDHRFERGTMRLLYPPARRQSVKVRAVADFLVATFAV